MKALLPALPLLFGFLLDAVLGDPYTLPHPVRLIGRQIAALERCIRSRMQHLRTGGTLLALCVLLTWTLAPLLLLWGCYRIHTVLGICTESVLCYYLLAARCLQKESTKVRTALEAGDIPAARQAVSMIVGRDTDCLDAAGITRAAVETVAENTTDGVTAPLFWMIPGGAVTGFFYKACNTMDSMIGYRNERYADIGRFAAKLDDVLGYLPSRLTALVMIAVSPLLRLDGRRAWRIWRRDARKHASPNSAQTESACAGALGVQLAGDAFYFGELHRKPFIGDAGRPIEPRDIGRANALMYLTSGVCLVLSMALRCLVWGGML